MFHFIVHCPISCVLLLLLLLSCHYTTVILIIQTIVCIFIWKRIRYSVDKWFKRDCSMNITISLWLILQANEKQKDCLKITICTNKRHCSGVYVSLSCFFMRTASITMCIYILITPSPFHKCLNSCRIFAFNQNFNVWHEVFPFHQ